MLLICYSKAYRDKYHHSLTYHRLSANQPLGLKCFCYRSILCIRTDIVKYEITLLIKDCGVKQNYFLYNHIILKYTCLKSAHSSSLAELRAVKVHIIRCSDIAWTLI